MIWFFVLFFALVSAEIYHYRKQQLNKVGVKLGKEIIRKEVFFIDFVNKMKELARDKSITIEEMKEWQKIAGFADKYFEDIYRSGSIMMEDADKFNISKNRILEGLVELIIEEKFKA